MGHGTSHRKQYLIIFAALAVLTALEIAVADPSLGIARTLVGVALVGMALAKAGLVLFFYMHLGTETKGLQYTVLLPALFPPFYAVILILETTWRVQPPW